MKAAMKAAVRCVSLALGGVGANTLARQELHGKRLDGTSLRRRIRDAKPLIYRTLDLRTAYDAHVAQVRANASMKRPVLHFILKFPDELLTDAAPGPFRKLRTPDERKQLMARQAVRFVNETHGGRAVFAARVDRDEAGELAVDVFATPVYEKITKTGKSSGLWLSPTKFGKDLARKHQGEIRRRHSDARASLTGPRQVGIALQVEFAVFFERENGVKLTRNPKNDPRPDRLETEAFKAVKAAEDDVARAKAGEDRRRDDFNRQARSWLEDQKVRLAAMERSLEAERHELSKAQAELFDEKITLREAGREVRALRTRLMDLHGRMLGWLRRPDLQDHPARVPGASLLQEMRSEMPPEDRPGG